MMDGYHMTGWGWFGMATMVIVAIIIVGVVVWAVNVRRTTDAHPHERSAREQLDARLASGEIDAQEYRERLDALLGNPTRT
jgi:uncharacterized membrane protein